jgi:hypothetical protein
VKSGTNAFHGTAYEYYVNEFMNAGDPFSFISGNPGNPSGGKYRPSNRRNDWGGTFGGPVWLPKIYNGKDKTFFFFSYERYKENQSLTFTDTLPAASYQAGNFSAICPNGGAGFNPNLGVPSAPPTGVGLNFGAFSGTSSGSVTNSGATGFPSSLVTGANVTGFPYANFLLGDVTSATQYAPVDARMYKSQWAVFVQDSWKATRRLTLNYGLRWDYGTPNREQHGRSASLGLTTPNPSAGGRPGAAIFEATCKCEFVKTYPYAIGPRLGVAYQLNDKTVFRGGWGFAYAPPNDLTLENTANITNTPTGVNAFLP